MSTQLLVYRFGSAAGFEGQFVGALERIEAGRAVRVLEVVFVAREPDGEVLAFDLHHGAGGIVAAALTFRLDPAQRRRVSEQALRGDTAELIRELAEDLPAGSAVAVVLVEQLWTRTLDDAVGRLDGQTLKAELVGVQRLTDLAPGAVRP